MISKILSNALIYPRKVFLDKLTKIHIVSFPKSGRTWVRFFLATYFSKKYDLDVYLSYRTLIRRHTQIPRFDFDHSVFYEKDLEPVLKYIDKIKNHKVILLVRDPRDVVVSFYYHTQHRQVFLDSRGLSISEFIRHEQLGIQRIVDFLNAWYEIRHSFSDFTIVRYEDLHAVSTQKQEFTKILELLEQDSISTDALEFAFHNSSFDTMKRIEKSEAVDHKMLRPGDLNNDNSFKVRKGEVGGYKQEFVGEDLDFVNKIVKSLHPDFGYYAD